ncbi:MAG: SusD/RagB family nutrient-binding outer membrane lipoprotein [Cyclobacteriaceae bacterium]|nr:SusD/RagB family nutrient-binding outer membrane lipoprotein [Cyclobacteriaceae bacterium]
MKKILSITTLCFTLVVTACNWDDFGDMNVNPNATTIPTTSTLLTNSMLSAGGAILASQGALYAQHLANKQYTSSDNYQTINFSTDGWYNGPLMDLKKIIELNTLTPEVTIVNGDVQNQIAVAQILMCYYYLHMTDRWGDLPYSEALQGVDGLLLPKFDSQESIYNSCFETLKSAAAAINTAVPNSNLKGDIILGGNMSRWVKFANTIRLNAALRLSKRNPTKAATEFASAFNDGVIALDNSENIRYAYLNVQTYENPYYNSFVTQGRADWVLADPLMNLMQLDTYTSPHLSFYSAAHPYRTATGKLNVVADPRLPVYANPIENTTNTFIGMPYGLSEANAGSISAAQVSFLGNAFRQRNTGADIFTSAQVAFILAEGRLNGWINAAPLTAQQYYEAGIQASLSQHGVAAGYANYITNTEVAYNPARAQEQIITQKWIALFPNGYEAWAEWRRTGFPSLAPGDNALTPNRLIPRRQAYGTAEANANTANHAAALQNQGFTADDLTGRVWWDAN